MLYRIATLLKIYSNVEYYNDLSNKEYDMNYVVPIKQFKHLHG